MTVAGKHRPATSTRLPAGRPIATLEIVGA